MEAHHLRFHAEQEKDFPIRCYYNNCFYSTDRKSWLDKHVMRFHLKKKSELTKLQIENKELEGQKQYYERYIKRTYSELTEEENLELENKRKKLLRKECNFLRDNYEKRLQAVEDKMTQQLQTVLIGSDSE
jgi:hypothetical protein